MNQFKKFGSLITSGKITNNESDVQEIAQLLLEAKAFYDAEMIAQIINAILRSSSHHQHAMSNNKKPTYPGRGDCPVAGTPYIVDLVFKNGSLSQANKITYQVKFDFGGDESILSIDKGSFDAAVKRDAETVVFNANNLSQNQNKSGVVILNAEDNNVSKTVIYTNLTINGITRSAQIDPAGPSILSIATEIINLAEKGFNLATHIANRTTPCINLNSSASDPQPEDEKAQYLVEVINCSNNYQNFRLSPHLPRDITLLKLDTPFDLPKKTTDNKTLIFGVAPTMEDMDYPFGVNGNVILIKKRV